MAQRYVWLTRAKPTVELLERAFTEQGVATYSEPLMAIAPLCAAHEQQAFSAAMANFEAVDSSIFISVNAVEQLLPLLTPRQLQQLGQMQVFAVGKATQRALKQHGIMAQAPTEATSSEALLALPSLQQVAKRRFYIFRGVGGRGYLQQVLAARGAEVSHVEVYRRTGPQQLSPQWHQLVAKQQLAVVVIGSIETFENLLAVYPLWDRSIALIAPSPRVGDFLTQQGCRAVFISPTAHNSDMVATAKRALQAD